MGNVEEDIYERDPATIPVDQLVNIGPKCSSWLRAVGLNTLADLQAIGSIQAYIKVVDECAEANTSINLLYAIDGAIDGVCFGMHSPRERDRLKEKLGEARQSAG